MRVLVVGTTPPPGGASALALARVAGAHLVLGDEVEVLTSHPSSVAHRVANLTGVLLGLRLLLVSRRFDALVIRLERGLPLSSGASRWHRALTLSVLGLALKTYRDVTIRLDTPIPMPGGVGGRATRDFWQSATRIVVENEEDRAELLALPGAVAGRVVIEPIDVVDEDRDRDFSQLEDDGTREEILTIVRSRSERARSIAATRRSLMIDDPDGGRDVLVQSKDLRPSALGVARVVLTKVKRGLVRARGARA